MALISFHRQLVYKVPSNLAATEMENPNYILRVLTLEDIENDEWLRKDKKSLINLMNRGHLAIAIFDKEKQKIAGRSMIALSPERPNHIPKIPKKSAWLHFGAVREEYRGHGFLKNMITFCVQIIHQKDHTIDIYTDTSEDNIPSRKNQIKLGLMEYGIYTVLRIGSQRLPFCCLQLGFWNKKMKHPDLEKAMGINKL